MLPLTTCPITWLNTLDATVDEPRVDQYLSIIEYDRAMTSHTRYVSSLNAKYSTQIKIVRRHKPTLLSNTITYSPSNAIYCTMRRITTDVVLCAVSTGVRVHQADSTCADTRDAPSSCDILGQRISASLQGSLKFRSRPFILMDRLIYSAINITKVHVR